MAFSVHAIITMGQIRAYIQEGEDIPCWEISLQLLLKNKVEPL